MNINQYITIFKALSDYTRLRIMNILIRSNKELCVCEIMDSLQEFQYNVSRHLKELKIAGLVKERKDGKWIFYSLAETKGSPLKAILQSVKSIPEEIFLMDTERLKARLSLREGEKCVIGLESKEWQRIRNQLLKGGKQHVQKA
ncbi:MAG: metalloregulator ArsR/SmtB family transcription factor [Nitrospirota bacterium]